MLLKGATMLDRWRRFIRRWISTTGARDRPPDDRARATAAAARDQRADEVQRLQHEIRALQQRITDLSATQVQGGDGPDRTPPGRELHSLYHALAQTQQALARLQARI